ncbi:hypothetical protein [Acidithiobacillus sp.]|uniref:hypothetical protein n=1 Tax=Acidithiobacillus sp. TaxID=1872118 RepID=UPI003D042030
MNSSAMAEAQVSLAQCQPTAASQPCKTFHGLCSQATVAHYSMVNIAQRLDNLVKQLPASSASAPAWCDFSVHFVLIVLFVERNS